MMEKIEGVSLADFAKLLATGDPASEKFYGKLYSFIPPSKPQALEFIGHIKLDKELFPNKHPSAIFVGDFSKAITTQADFIPLLKDNKLALFCILQKLELPQGDYFAIISPFSKQDKDSSYALAYESIAFIRSLLALFFGKLFQYTWIADFEFDTAGNLSVASPAFRMPLHADFFKIIAPELATKIIDRLKLQLPDYRIRLQRACNLFDKALNQNDEAYRFASYWIALEVLVGSSGQAIEKKLAEAYGFGNDVSRVSSLLLFEVISNIRGDLIHKGTFKKLLSYQERLLQLYFWDIVIHQIGLAPQGLARMLVESGVVDEELKSEQGR
jgi:hypothetical protein